MQIDGNLKKKTNLHYIQYNLVLFLNYLFLDLNQTQSLCINIWMGVRYMLPKIKDKRVSKTKCDMYLSITWKLEEREVSNIESFRELWRAKTVSLLTQI